MRNIKLSPQEAIARAESIVRNTHQTFDTSEARRIMAGMLRQLAETPRPCACLIVDDQVVSPCLVHDHYASVEAESKLAEARKEIEVLREHCRPVDIAAADAALKGKP